MEHEKSLCDLMNEAFSLSLLIVFESTAPNGYYFIPRKKIGCSSKEEDMVTGWCDGLSHKYYKDKTTGKCSWNSFVEFNIEEFEKSVKEDIKTMKTILKKLSPIFKLNYDTMWAMGYRGSWAGDFKQLKNSC